MTRKLEFATNIDLKGNEILNVAIENVASIPGASIPGRVVYVTGENAGLYVDTGAAVVKLGQASSADEVAGRVTALETWKTTAQSSIEANATKAAANESAISALTGRVDTAEDDIDTIEGKVSALEEDNTQNKTDIAALKTAVGSTGEGGDSLLTRVTALETNIATKQDKDTAYTDSEAEALKTELEGKINAKANSADVYTSTQVDTKLADYYKKTETYSKTEVDSAISAKVASVYRVMGTVANETALPAGAAKGDVYNITAASTYGPAGTNVVWDGSAWDALGGITDLTAYATTEFVNGQVSTLNQSIGTKVDQTAYNAKVQEIEGNVSSNSTKIGTLEEDVAEKVDQSAYDTKMGQLGSAIAGKAAKVTQAGGTYTKVTVNNEGIVTSGAALEAGDIPALTASKISDFAAEVKKVRYKEVFSAAGTTQVVTHGLGVEYPHVTVFNTTTGAIIYAEVVYTDTNKVTINGNVDLGAITVVVSP